MALKATIFKADVQLADIDHGHYTDLGLTLALNAHQVQDLCGGDARIGFGAGLSSPDEPDVLLQDFTGRARLWIEVGQPDDKALAKACSKADAVAVYAYGPAADVWWRGIEPKLARLERLSVWRLPAADAQALATLAERGMALQATLHDGVLTLSGARGNVSVEPLRWK